MNIELDEGNIAGVNWSKYYFQNLKKVEAEGAAFWVRGRGVTLSSGGFGPCVGLVLSGDLPHYGAVAHFWNPAGLEEAKVIVDQYMRWLYAQTGGYCGDDVEAVVFGGSALGTKTSGGQTLQLPEDVAQTITKPRLTAIAEYLESRWEMRVVQGRSGSKSVSIDLSGTGSIEDLVTLDVGALASKPHLTAMSPRSKSNSSGTVTRQKRSGSK